MYLSKFWTHSECWDILNAQSYMDAHCYHLMQIWSLLFLLFWYFALLTLTRDINTVLRSQAVQRKEESWIRNPCWHTWHNSSNPHPPFLQTSNIQPPLLSLDTHSLGTEEVCHNIMSQYCFLSQYPSTNDINTMIYLTCWSMELWTVDTILLGEPAGSMMTHSQ